MQRVLSEDLTGLDFAGRPQEIPITTFFGREVSGLAPHGFHREILADIARAIVDRGWPFGVRACEVTVRQDFRTVNGRRVAQTRMTGKLTYA